MHNLENYSKPFLLIYVHSRIKSK